MKKFKYIFSIIIIAVITFSCVDESIDNGRKNNETEIKLLHYGNNGINKSSGYQILEFSDFKTYLNTIENLEKDIESLENSFNSEWSYLDDEALNAKEDELNFNSDNPLIDFENHLRFSSLRKKFITEEDKWLDNEVLDEKNSPLDYAIYNLDETEMTLVNSLGEVKIGKAIYKKLNQTQIDGVNKYLDNPIDDGFIQINDSNFENLIDFNNGDFSLITQDNFDIMFDYPIPCWIVPCNGNDDGDNGDDNSNNSTTCKQNKNRKRYFNTGSNKKVWAKVKMSGRRAKAKLRSYKKGSRRWKKWRTYMNVKIQGFTKDYNCDWGEAINKSNSGRKKRIKAVKRSTYKRVSQGEMANVLSHNGQNKTLFLTW